MRMHIILMDHKTLLILYLLLFVLLKNIMIKHQNFINMLNL